MRLVIPQSRKYFDTGKRLLHLVKNTIYQPNITLDARIPYPVTDHVSREIHILEPDLKQKQRTAETQLKLLRCWHSIYLPDSLGYA